MDNLENSIRHKLDDAELTPPNNMWSRIEAELPQEKKRRALIWMWLIPLCLIGGVTIYYINTKNTNQPVTQNIIGPSTINSDIKPRNINPPIDNNNPLSDMNFNSNNSRQGSANNFGPIYIAPRNEGNIIPAQSDFSNQYEDLQYINSIKRLNLFASNFKDEKPTDYNVKPYQASKNKISEDRNDPNDKKNSTEKPCHFVFESVNNVYKSGRALIANSNATPDQKNYIKVRNSIEYGKIGFSGGIALKYCINKHLMVGSGIRMMHFTEDLIYNKRDVNIAFEAPPIGIDELVKKKYPYTFTKQTDSIYAGQNYYGGTNYYYFREVPITFGYYNYGKKWNYYIEPAISYCRITFIKASLLDLDHVGFTTVNQIDGYQGVSHIFNASMRAGFGLNVAKTVSVNFGLYGSRAITPLINYGYAKQLPYTYGITLGIEKRL